MTVRMMMRVAFYSNIGGNAHGSFKIETAYRIELQNEVPADNKLSILYEWPYMPAKSFHFLH
jgi:hypothetical protein